MSDETNSTKELDEAKKDSANKVQDKIVNSFSFIKTSLASGLTLLLTCSLSLGVIYLCKIGKTGVLPTNMKYYPYTDLKKNNEETITDIFANFPFSKERKSMKISFEKKDTISDYIINYLNSFIYDKDSSFMLNFIISVVISVINKNYVFFNYMFSLIDNLPEMMLINFGLYIFIIIVILSVIANTLFFIWYWISNLDWMLRKKKDTTMQKGNNTVEWRYTYWKSPTKDPGDSEWIEYGIGIYFMVMMVILLIMITIIPFVLVISGGLTFFCLLSMFIDYSIKLNGKVSDYADLFKYFFFFNKTFIAFLFSISIVQNAYNTGGGRTASFALLTIILIYSFGIIDMFSVKESEGMRTPLLYGGIKSKFKEFNAKISAVKKKLSEKQNQRLQNKLSVKSVPSTQPLQPYYAPPLQPVPSAPPLQPVPSAPPLQPVQTVPPIAVQPEMLQKGGKKINSSNLSRELHKFYKKYAKVLI
jgi:hypothetical protein